MLTEAQQPTHDFGCTWHGTPHSLPKTTEKISYFDIYYLMGYS
jgi:hypothetical protein